VRDNNEASWTQVLEVLEFMSDATSLPILLDGDTGYGNFNNVRRLVRKLEQRGVAGVCLEDKLFPKTNSFIDGERQALAAVDEFCGKLRAAKDIQQDPDFVVVARTEAFIAGWGLEEALLRATAYASSGADAILCHSKRVDSAEIMSFMDHWSGDVPVVIVPTKYPSEPLASFVERGITNFIFANHAVRTVIKALQQNLRTLRETADLMSIEHEIAPVAEVFRLQNAQELRQSERRYLPNQGSDTRALILAATKGDFGEMVADRPKAMLYLHGKPILARHAGAFRRQGIKQIAAVRGYRKEAVDLAGLTYFDNDEHAATGELWSLYTAREFLVGDILVAYGDIIFDDVILQNLLAHGGGIRIAVDLAWRLRQRSDEKPDLVATEGVDDPVDGEVCQLRAIGSDLPPEQVSGDWIGLLYLEREQTAQVVELLRRLERERAPLLRAGSLPDLLNLLVEEGHHVTVVHSYGHWHDLDDQKALLAVSEQGTGQPDRLG
jgi:phosphoenolpyruvate phosphomutase